MHATFPTHITIIDFTTLRTPGEQCTIMKLLIMQFSPASCHIFPLRSNYSQHLFINVLNPRSSFSVTDKFHTYTKKHVKL